MYIYSTGQTYRQKYMALQELSLRPMNNLSLDNKNLKIHYEINAFLKYTLDTIIATPRNSYE